MSGQFDAVVLAAGSGTRFLQSGGSTYKQLVPFEGTPVIRRIVDIAERNPLINGVTVVLGEDADCSRAIRDVLQGTSATYKVNEDSARDNNFLSFLIGIEDVMRGAVAIEADCVFSATDLSALLRATSANEIGWANVGPIAPHSSGGVIAVAGDEAVEGIHILDEQELAAFKCAKAGLKMYGLTAFGCNAIETYRSRMRSLPDGDPRYFHEVAIQRFTDFKHVTVRMSDMAFSFNTLEQFHGNGR